MDRSCGRRKTEDGCKRGLSRREGGIGGGVEYCCSRRWNEFVRPMDGRGEALGPATAVGRRLRVLMVWRPIVRFPDFKELVSLYSAEATASASFRFQFGTPAAVAPISLVLHTRSQAHSSSTPAQSGTSFYFADASGDPKGAIPTLLRYMSESIVVLLRLRVLRVYTLDDYLHPRDYYSASMKQTLIEDSTLTFVHMNLDMQSKRIPSTRPIQRQR